MTRRKKTEEVVKTHVITSRLNDIEYELVSGKAKDAGMSMSEYLRQIAIHGKVDVHNHIVADFEKLDQIARDLSGIGNNLNQLTRYFHMGGVRSEAMQDELLRCINEVMKMRKEVLELGGEYRGYAKAHLK